MSKEFDVKNSGYGGRYGSRYNPSQRKSYNSISRKIWITMAISASRKTKIIGQVLHIDGVARFRIQVVKSRLSPEAIKERKLRRLIHAWR